MKILKPSSEWSSSWYLIRGLFSSWRPAWYLVSWILLWILRIWEWNKDEVFSEKMKENRSRRYKYTGHLWKRWAPRCTIDFKRRHDTTISNIGEVCMQGQRIRALIIQFIHFLNFFNVSQNNWHLLIPTTNRDHMINSFKFHPPHMSLH